MFNEYEERLRRCFRKEYLITLLPTIWLVVFGVLAIAMGSLMATDIAITGFLGLYIAFPLYYNVVSPRINRCS